MNAISMSPSADFAGHFTDAVQRSVADYAHAYLAAGCPHGRSVEGLAEWLEDEDGEWVDADALQPYLRREGLIEDGHLI
jgi:hypothetical protein